MSRRRVPPRTLKVTMAYDGTNYAGWQRQANALSIQQVVEDAFRPLMGDRGGAWPSLEAAGASRTDAGVHASAQVASIDTDIELDAASVGRALNDRLPPDIRVLDVTDAAPGFHARFDAAGKSYRYRLVAGPVASPFDRWFVWHAPGRRDVGRMGEAARAFVGTHDFASFQARGASITDTTRTIERLAIETCGDEIVFAVDGTGFLRHMVRAIVGTLAEIGAGARPVDAVPGMLAARDRRAAGATAPASGLMLTGVRY